VKVGTKGVFQQAVAFCELRLDGVLRSSRRASEVGIILVVERVVIRSLAEAGREGGRRMEKTGLSYSSGEWLVRAGSEEEFIQRWISFIEWTLDNADGAESFVLVRSTEEPRFFSLWERGRASRRRRRGERCPRCR
jgi:predicted hydrocarbon binding protein